MSLMAMSLVTGCVQPDVHPDKNRKSSSSFWGDLSNEDDVDMSDDNLTESEMMITEDGEEDRMERVKEQSRVQFM
jgi:hypothetical protein